MSFGEVGHSLDLGGAAVHEELDAGEVAAVVIPTKIERIIHAS
jgi:hypothetical protein